MALKEQVKDKAKELGLLDVMINLAKHTGRFQAVEIQKLDHLNNWQTDVGYTVVNSNFKVLEMVPASLICTKKQCFVVKTEVGYFFCDQHEISKTGYINKSSTKHYVSKPVIKVAANVGY
ncbi:hypothetical protein UA32_12585 [Photobacterium angustum]|uniref:Uncharacterized protein n=1 Tax=Photobacterium angustum TaxID=661 RepID=A0ABX5H136_PHOAN|nr:hypothetical protein [Photobacterium angustum]KJG37782.1 hypothetical protein UA32_12585 [Photobacterium angustum]PSX07052.1 hypothetical protein C0W27_15905 [Photobacterium angustum]